MFSKHFAPEMGLLDAETAVARKRRRREVDNALLSHLMSGLKPAPEVFAALQTYIDGGQSREKAFAVLYEAH